MHIQIEFFVSNYDSASAQAEALDSRIQQAASQISASGEYYNLLSLATRQVFGALDFTAPASSGEPARIFMKDMGVSG